MKYIITFIILVIVYENLSCNEPISNRYYTLSLGGSSCLNVLFPNAFIPEECKKMGYEEGLTYACLIDFNNLKIKPGIFWIITGFCYQPPKSDIPMGTKNTRHFGYRTSQGIRCEAIIVYEKGLYNRTDYFPTERTAVTLDSIPIEYVPQAELLFNSILFDDKKTKGNIINGIKRFDFETTK